MIKQRLQTMILSMLVAMAAWGDVWDGSIATSFAGGTGTEDDPYQVTTGAELAFLAQQVNGGETFADKKIVLANDIVLNNNLEAQVAGGNTGGLHAWMGIGCTVKESNVTTTYEFKGRFDGQQHRISGLYQKALFGVTGTGAVITRVGIVDSYIGTESYQGTVCSTNAGTISYCFNTGKVNGSYSMSGICYKNTAGGVISSCFNSGDIDCSYNAAGICVENSGTVEYCFNTGHIDGTYYKGGICDTNSGTCRYSYNAGKLTGVYTNYISGTCRSGSSTSCYHATNATGVTTGSTATTIATLAGGALFNDADHWVESAGHYPLIKGLEDVDEAKIAVATVVPAGSESYSLMKSDFMVSSLSGIQWEKSNDAVDISGAQATINSTGNVVLTASAGSLSKTFELTTVKNNWGGSGTADDPYTLSTAADLTTLAYEVNNGTLYGGSYFLLTADIDLDGSEANPWTPIGVYEAWNEKYFAGVLDGGGHVIKNLYIHETSFDGGFFSRLDKSTAVIKNLGFVNAKVLGDERCMRVGVICGSCTYATITNCYVQGTLTVRGQESAGCGAICGEGYQAKISNCYSLCSIDAACSSVGGIVGSSYRTTLTNCYNAGTVRGVSYVGGICGNYYSTATASGCYNAGPVYGSSYTGALFGQVGSDSRYPTTVANCFYDKTLLGDMGGINGADAAGKAEGKTTAELTSGSFFSNAEVWTEASGLYPRLAGMEDTDAAKLSALPVYLADGDRLAYLANDFTVSTAFGTIWASQNGLASVAGEQVTLTGGSGPEVLTATLNGTQRTVDILVAHAFDNAGTAADPYLINSVSDLETLRDMVAAGCSYEGKYFRQTCAISLGAGGSQWQPIGSKTAAFKGNYDGNGYTVSGLDISSNEKYQALFGYVTGSVIQNLTVSGSVTADSYVALLVAYGNAGTIMNCHAVGTVRVQAIASTSMEDYMKGYAAGICGKMDNGGTISDCVNEADVTVTAASSDPYSDISLSYAAGICGDFRQGTLQRCLNYGSIDNTASYASYTGGIVGFSEISTISECMNMGTVAGYSYVGGIVGGFNGNLQNCVNTGALSSNNTYSASLGGISGSPSGDTSYPTVIQDCLNYGTLTTGETIQSVGNIYGYSYSSSGFTVKNCYYDSSVNPDVKGIGSNSNHAGTDNTTNNVVGKTTAELKDGSTLFTTAASGVWKYRAGQYPQLTVFAIEDGDVLTAEVGVEDGTSATATVEVKAVSAADKTVAIQQLADMATDGIIDIPSKVTLVGEAYTVVAIGNNAFQGAANLEGVVIPSTVTEIGVHAFDECPSLTSVTFEGSAMPTLGEGALSTQTVAVVTFPAAAYDHYDASLGNLGFTQSVYQPTVFMNSGEWTTIYSTQSYSLPEGLEAYIVADMDYADSKILIAQEAGIQKDVPMLLRKTSADRRFSVTENSSFTIMSSGERSSIFKGAASPQTIVNTETSQAFILYNNSFVRSANGTLPAYRCYLQLDPTHFSAPAAASRLGIEVVESETSGIRQTDTLSSDAMPWFTLEGRAFEARPAAKGLYIHNGKKVIIK